MRKNEDILQNLFLFHNLSHSEIMAVTDNKPLNVCSYAKGDVIFSPNGYDENVGFILSGRCEVRRAKHDGASVVLNILNKYDSFGVIAAFSCEDFPTDIYAVSAVEILFFSKSQIIEFMEKNHKISLNMIEFLTDRINFLNKRIATFTCTTVEEKLASFLLSQYARYKTPQIPFNCQKTSAVINSGRASVYRALTALADAGYITYDTKKIIINDPKELERTLK